MTATGRPRGVPKGTPKPAGSGRQKGTGNVITDKVKGDLLACYTKMGGRRFMLKYFQDHPEEMMKYVTRLIPVPREEPLVQINNTNRIDTSKMSDVEIASRIAYALALGLNNGMDPSKKIIEVEIPARALPKVIEVAPVEIPPVEIPAEPQQVPTDAYHGKANEQDRHQRTSRVVTKRNPKSLL